LLYFWSQHLDGNANWLEILLFGVGVVFLLIELFVVPGFGIFGIGGMLMVVVSIVLASQTFVIPSNTEEFNQLPRSLFAVTGAMGGMVAAMIVFRNLLPNTPYFKRLMLDPPAVSRDSFPDGKDPEAVVNWGHLVGRQGISITLLAPSGKARIDGQLIDVISDGRLIEKNQAVVVSEVSGNRVQVQQTTTHT
ncbi:MAG: NfeD family protein, partial [Planctomycetota bacterium]